MHLTDPATAHLELLRAYEQIEGERPELLVEYSPSALRAAGADPVAVLDLYRSLGLRVAPVEGLPPDPGELVLALDAAGVEARTLRLEFVDRCPGPGERFLPASARLGRKWARRFPPSVQPGTLAYDSSHRALVSSLIDSEEWAALFAAGGRLPAGLGAAYDERVVEYPWLFSHRLSGRVLDAGSVLNHRHLIERLAPAAGELTIVTLAPEPRAFTELGVSYLYADLRRLPFRDSWFDEVVCLSTLEHVGMDNALYGAPASEAENPGEEAAAALRELLRVVRPGGRVHLSVPFGQRESFGWMRQFDREDVDALFAAAGVSPRERVVFRHTSRGWRRGQERRAAGARYNPAPAAGEDGAVAARAVLCATIEV